MGYQHISYVSLFDPNMSSLFGPPYKGHCQKFSIPIYVRLLRLEAMEVNQTRHLQQNLGMYHTIGSLLSSTEKAEMSNISMCIVALCAWCIVQIFVHLKIVAKLTMIFGTASNTVLNYQIHPLIVIFHTTLGSYCLESV